MPAAGIPLKFLFQVQVTDLGIDIKVIAGIINIDVVIKIAVDKRSIGKQLAIENMIPSECAGYISPS